MTGRNLGQETPKQPETFQNDCRYSREQIISHATRSDIAGICEGNDLNSLLPLEYCYLAEKSLQPIFFERFIEKRLQVIDYQSHEKQTINDKKTIGNEVSEEAEGPFIVCLDTSGSMAGEREESRNPPYLPLPNDGSATPKMLRHPVFR